MAEQEQSLRAGSAQDRGQTAELGEGTELVGSQGRPWRGCFTAPRPPGQARGGTPLPRARCPPRLTSRGRRPKPRKAPLETSPTSPRQAALPGRGCSAAPPPHVPATAAAPRWMPARRRRPGRQRPQPGPGLAGAQRGGARRCKAKLRLAPGSQQVLGPAGGMGVDSPGGSSPAPWAPAPGLVAAPSQAGPGRARLPAPLPGGRRRAKDTCWTARCVVVSGDWDSLSSCRICWSPCSSGFHSYSILGRCKTPDNGGRG